MELQSFERDLGGGFKGCPEAIGEEGAVAVFPVSITAYLS